MPISRRDAEFYEPREVLWEQLGRASWRWQAGQATGYRMRCHPCVFQISAGTSHAVRGIAAQYAEHPTAWAHNQSCPSCRGSPGPVPACPFGDGDHVDGKGPTEETGCRGRSTWSGQCVENLSRPQSICFPIVFSENRGVTIALSLGSHLC